jgi:subtilisin family serine protease
VRVAVVDSAFDAHHPDLRDNFAWNAASGNQREIPKYGLDLIDSTGLVTDDVASVDDVNPTTPADQTDVVHGTHVAGIITGVAPHATLVPIRLLNDKGATNNTWQHLTVAIKHADSVGAFVMNNSWGQNFVSDTLEIQVKTKQGNRTRYFLRPRIGMDGQSYAKWPVIDSRFQDKVVAAVTEANQDNRKPGLLVVFAAGNDGWNSETGLIPVFRTEENAEKYRKDGEREEDQRHIRATYPALEPHIETLNLPGPLSAAFLKHTALKGYWLAVIATDQQNRIAKFSSGCGEAANYCLAAPGVEIRSTIPGGGYKSESGTSMAAPMVSGAAAVLKQVFPNLSAKGISTILLCTATDLDKTSGRPTKLIEQCAENGPEAVHKNGWMPSKVYGHGLLNLARALAEPIGQTSAAAGNALGVAAASDTRVAFSSAFGDAAPSQPFSFGGFDMFGRVYNFRAPLQDRVMPGPRLAGVMAMTTPATPVMMGRANGVTTMLRRSGDADSAIGEGGVVSYIGARSRTDLALVNRRTGSALSPAALLRGSDAVTPVWEALAPRARDIIGAESDWQLSRNLHAGMFFSRASVAAATQRGETYSLRDYGVSSRLGNRRNGIEARLGQLKESGRFLGSQPEGGYALARPTRSDYLRLRASRQLTPGLSIGAEWLRLRARVDFRHDAFVRDMTLDARAAGMHMTASDLASEGDRLVLHYGEPLAVTGGVMRQTSITGYTSSGAYRATTRDLDLAVTRWHRMVQMAYQRPLAGRVSGFAVAAHHRNWSHQGGLTNNLVMVGLSLSH